MGPFALPGAITQLFATRRPVEPPDYSDPPPVATDGFVTIQTSARVPMSVTAFRAFLLDQPLIGFLKSTDRIAHPLNRVTLRGTWEEVDAVQRLELADGHFVIERILENRPDLFRYQVWSFTNEARMALSHIVGEQRFIAEDETTTRFEWTYNMKPKSPLMRFFVSRQKDDVAAFLDAGTQAMANAAKKAAQR